MPGPAVHRSDEPRLPLLEAFVEDTCDWLEERFREIVGHDPPTQELPGRLL
jgi:hypothetical protein